MKDSKNLKEIDDHLPNGFHDALLEAVTVNFVSKTAIMDLQLWVGDLDATQEKEQEAYKSARLALSDLVYFVIDAPGANHEFSWGRPMRIDAGEAANDNSVSASPKPLATLPTGAFAYWFFVEPWNSFIHVAARMATLQWAERSN